ncbi:MAG: response regulator [Pseudomonadota bacterium]
METECSVPDCAKDFHVLLVDDNDAFRSLITQQLERLGACVDGAANAGGFLTRIAAARRPYDLAVVDLRLPDLRGDHIISWLGDSEVEQVAALPILLVTGHPQSVPPSILHGSARVGVLCKPYGFADLARAVSRLLAQETV